MGGPLLTISPALLIACVAVYKLLPPACNARSHNAVVCRFFVATPHLTSADDVCPAMCSVRAARCAQWLGTAVFFSQRLRCSDSFLQFPRGLMLAVSIKTWHELRPRMRLFDTK